jgi:hypothetical protein
MIQALWDFIARRQPAVFIALGAAALGALGTLASDAADLIEASGGQLTLTAAVTVIGGFLTRAAVWAPTSEIVLTINVAPIVRHLPMPMPPPKLPPPRSLTDALTTASPSCRMNLRRLP